MSAVLHTLVFALVVSSAAQSSTDQLLDGTKVIVELQQFISSEASTSGDSVRLTVAEDVEVGGRVLIARGTPVVATIANAQPTDVHDGFWRFHVSTGQLQLLPGDTADVDGHAVRLRATAARTSNRTAAVQDVQMPAQQAMLRWAHPGERFNWYVDADR